jgi:hypothetical protein
MLAGGEALLTRADRKSPGSRVRPLAPGQAILLCGLASRQLNSSPLCCLLAVSALGLNGKSMTLL